MAEKELQENTTENETKLYELGFHLVPTFSEEKVLGKLSEMVALIEKNGGVVKSSKNPELRPLAYEIGKSGGGKKEHFDSSFFGYVIFEMERNKVVAFHKAIKGSAGVLRILLVEVPKDILAPRERRIPQSHKEEVKRTSEKSLSESKPINEEELHKTIEQLVIE